MTTMITLPEQIAVQLQRRATDERLSVEALAIAYITNGLTRPAPSSVSASTAERANAPALLALVARMQSVAFADEVAKRRPKGSAARTAGARHALQRNHREHATPMSQRATEARARALRLAHLVNAAYGLTTGDVDLLWAMAPPRMLVGRGAARAAGRTVTDAAA